MEKNKWIDDVLNSVEGMEPAGPPADMFKKIQDKVRRGKVKVIPLRTVVASAACIALLIMFNITLMSRANTSSSVDIVQNNDIETVSDYYGLTETSLYQ